MKSLRFTILLLLLFGQVNGVLSQIEPIGDFGGVNTTSGARDRGKSKGDSARTSAKNLPRSNPQVSAFQGLSMGLDSFVKPDTTLPYLQRYNKARASGLPFTDLGHYSSPQYSLLLNPFSEPGLQNGLQPYSFQNKKPAEITFYNAKMPFTRFNYVQGGDGFIVLDALHTQNISKNWNITLDYSSVNNGELYEGGFQDHMHRATRAGSFYTSKNGKYKQFLVLNWNRARRNENGGIIKDSVFFNDARTDTLDGIGINERGFYYPRLKRAKSFYGNRHHLFEQQWNVFEKGVYLYQRTDWSRTVYRFLDPKLDTAFYGSTRYFSKDTINDSCAWNGLNNAAGLGFKIKKAQTAIAGRAYYGYEYANFSSLHFLSGKDIYHSHGLHGEAELRSPIVSAQLKMDAYVAGYNSGDRNLNGWVKFNIGEKSSLNLGVHTQKYTQALRFRRFFGNQFRFINDFNSTSISELNAGFTIQTKSVLLNFTGRAGNVNGLVYSFQKPEFQQADKLNYAQLQARVQFKLGSFYTDHQFVLQQYSNKQVFAAPAFSTLSSFYFQGHLFKKAMLARFGVDVNYYSTYTAYAYRPDMALFYISPGGRPAGNYPYADLFFSGEVKTLIFTVKLEHWNNYIANAGYNNAFFSARNYAGEPMRLLIGLNWRFYY